MTRHSRLIVTLHVPIRDKKRLPPPVPVFILAAVTHTRQEETMAKSTQAVPKGYHTVTPSLMVAGAARAIDFYKKALGAQEVMRFPGPDGKNALPQYLFIFGSTSISG